MRSCVGASKKCSGVPSSMIRPSSIITTRSADLAREAHLVADDDHRHPLARQLLHHRRAPRRSSPGRARWSARRRASARAASPARGRSRRAAAARRRAAPGRRRPCRPARRARAASRPISRASSSAMPRTWIGASMMFSSAVMCGNRLKRWKTMPISRALRARCSAPCPRPACRSPRGSRSGGRSPRSPRLDLLEVVDAAQERRLARARTGR